MLKGEGKKVADLKGTDVNLVELSVSHYLLARAWTRSDLTRRDLKVVNTSDADISAAFTHRQVNAVTTWNPMLSDIKAKPGGDRSVQLQPDPRRDHGHDGGQLPRPSKTTRPWARR